ncbi:hypothetical protein Dtox_1410 [Desulfofarcimen acetoxidans DSM 771]|uniref:DUF3854 domain-containing protein n=1 Tax=Desulfofarcimen acetoxidans (strain ATCC 49208 / DSM 771 / KCTC 5769 / VKM B-1644 / 5575) TaxID=485916 RepID=C8W6J6_DESAS|nr:toprim domain-containing protein [Desulfofarcimen acetoxidans]ACV62285.1 hypothetical protein Dtox_1410 [Desulfofarcimen acetoxidans DSM 771]
MIEEKRINEPFQRVNQRHLCPVCGKPDWCAFNSTIAICMRVESKYPIKNGGWLHKLSEPLLAEALAERTEDKKEIAPLEVRDEIYKRFLNLLTLSAEHIQELLKRGLNTDQIKEMRSLSAAEKPWLICQKLIDMGYELRGVPGFYRAPNKHGGYYWTFKMKPGFILPIKDKTKKIQALQIRLDRPDSKGKYRLFSSSNKRAGSCSGVPLHVAIPREIKDRRVWITEGPLKATVAAEYLEAVVLGLIGATTWRAVPEILKSRKPEVVIAFDMDQQSNCWVGRAVKELSGQLSLSGHKVTLATWIGPKGIDDAVVSGVNIKYEEV